MIETTIKAIFADDVTPSPHYLFYLVRDGVTTFFLGCAPGNRDIIKRMTYRLVDTETKVFRRFWGYNFPASGAWQVELFTLAARAQLLDSDRYLFKWTE